MPTINEMIDFCEDMAAYDCFSNEQFARREMFYAISDELKKTLRELKIPRGEWLKVGGIFYYVKCSNCNFELKSPDDKSNFCPECGLPMNEKALEILRKRAGGK